MRFLLRARTFRERLWSTGRIGSRNGFGLCSSLSENLRGLGGLNNPNDSIRSHVRIGSAGRHDDRRKRLFVCGGQAIAKGCQKLELNRRHCDCNLFFIHQSITSRRFLSDKKAQVKIVSPDATLAKICVDFPVLIRSGSPSSVGSNNGGFVDHKVSPTLAPLVEIGGIFTC